MAQNTVIVDIIRLVDANKTKAAFLAPLITAVGSAIASYIVSGDFNDKEILAAAGGAVLAVVSGVSTYLTKAQQAVVVAPPTPVNPAVPVPVALTK